jgi:hypothetical protein
VLKSGGFNIGGEFESDSVGTMSGLAGMGARIVTSDCDKEEVEEVLRRFRGFGEESLGSLLGDDECIRASMEEISRS